MGVSGARCGARGGAVLGVFLVAILFATVASAADKTDAIVLKNGDRITGEIRGLQNGLLSYKTDTLGTLSVEWHSVAKISSIWLFILEDSQGRRYTGSLQNGPEPGQVVVRTGEGPVTLQLADLVGIARYGARLSQRFQGFVDGAFTLQKAQKERTLNLAAQINYISTKWDIRADASSYLSSRENAVSTTRELLSLDARRVYKNRWSGAAFGQLEKNTELNLDLRLLGGLGVGRYFIRTNRRVLDGVAAVDVTRENYYGDTASKTGAEAVFGIDYQAFRYVFPNMNISASAYAYPSLTTSGRVRLKFQTNFRYELFSRFYVSLGFVDNYDSKPGGEGTTKNDYGLNLGISWSLN